MDGSRRRRTADEPTAAELTAIGREWPVIAAELAVVDAEVALANAEGAGTELDARRLLNAEAALDAVRRVPVRRPGRRSKRTA
jgi:hypothetical protein